MQAQIPEVKAAVHLLNRQMTVTTGNRNFLDHVDVVSPNFFRIIQLPLVAGDRATLFAQPESAVITESMAKKYFGDAPALGKMLRVGPVCEFGPEPELQGTCVTRQADVLVTGVARDLPHNTQLTGDVFIPNTSAADPMSPGEKQKWLDNNGYGYVELAPGVNLPQVVKKVAALIDRSVDLDELTAAGRRAAAANPFPRQ